MAQEYHSHKSEFGLAEALERIKLSISDYKNGKVFTDDNQFEGAGLMLVVSNHVRLITSILQKINQENWLYYDAQSSKNLDAKNSFCSSDFFVITPDKITDFITAFEKMRNAFLLYKENIQKDYKNPFFQNKLYEDVFMDLYNPLFSEEVLRREFAPTISKPTSIKATEQQRFDFSNSENPANVTTAPNLQQ